MLGRKTGGRKKGTPNKLTESARKAFELAFQKMDGAQGLLEWAKDHQTDFYKLYARLIPVNMEHSGSLTIEDLLEKLGR